MRSALRNKDMIRAKMGEPVLFEVFKEIGKWRESAEIPKKGDRLTIGRFELEVTRVTFDVVSLALKKVIQ